MRVMKFLFSVFILQAIFQALLQVILCRCAFAEYRMFTLKITNTETQDFRLVNSTLDPFQYPAYYPVRAHEIVQYTDTWRCYGRTSPDIPPCPNPRAPAPEGESAASGGVQSPLGLPAQAQPPAPEAIPERQNEGPAPVANPPKP